MIILSLRRFFVACFLVSMLWVGGCSSPATTNSSPAPNANGAAVSSQAIAGSQFNKFFPTNGNGFERVYTQEKDGFAEAKLKKDGKDLAMLAISDTISTPAAAQKFQQSSKQVAGYPAVEVGSTQTAVLVANRFQVKVISRDPNFTAADREAWLQKFDLNGLARLK
ncbi:MAG TPA: hypothetical protein IGS17_12050 [Oscillatoriales cyanobacterium M59_W2019_021]|nr:MAG: hypothetical protein D6728_08520 [Cyanobacteria bacterium J055]HIK33927.1 hypothetical protein [Oscillatoriales cyanobacterium M4454_W2019_049]HIK51634.1 hypothetical protein [Oscillatoriales cyanobacterium M59_W2019_021]